jgi:hypothetical protein
MAFEVKKAKRESVTPSILLVGASGSGKSYSSLALASGMGKKIIAIDTENKRLNLYADDFDFSKIDLKPPYSTARYIAAVEAALEQSPDVIIIDQISFEWAGTGGILQQVDDSPATNQMMRWKEPSRAHSDFIDYLLHMKVPFIANCRAKEQYEMSKDEAGKTKVIKLGLGPIQRGRNAGEGIEYEFILSFLIDEDHYAKPLLDRTKLFGRLVQDEESGEMTTVGEKVLLSTETGRKIMSWAKGGKVTTAAKKGGEKNG